MYGRGNGSFGMPFEECSPSGPVDYGRSYPTVDGSRNPTAGSTPARRRLLAPPRLAKLLASKPEQEQYLVLVSRHSNAFLQVEWLPLKTPLPPPDCACMLLSHTIRSVPPTSFQCRPNSISFPCHSLLAGRAAAT